MQRTVRATLTAPPARASLRKEGLDAIRAEIVDRRVAAAYAEGRADGAREALAGAGRLLDAAVQQVEVARIRAEQDLPREVLELAVEVADPLLRARLADGAYDLERIVRSALAGGGVGRGRCVVRLHPTDLQRLAGVQFREDTVLVAQADIAIGTVHVETSRGLLVRDPVEALEQIREALLEGLV
jgi:flagellar biosynthesis/type III secretory pathway protein FliH